MPYTCIPSSSDGVLGMCESVHACMNVAVLGFKSQYNIHFNL